MQMQKYDFKADNSPWTELYAMYCQREELAAMMPAASTATAAQDEQQPTHDALADVYNRDDAVVTSKRF